MNVKTMLKIGKIAVEVAQFVVPAAASFFKKRELDEQIAKKVAEEVAKVMENQVKGS